MSSKEIKLIFISSTVKSATDKFTVDMQLISIRNKIQFVEYHLEIIE